MALAGVGLSVSDLLFKQMLMTGTSVLQVMALFMPGFLLMVVLMSLLQGGVRHNLWPHYPGLMAQRGLFVVGFTFFSLWGLSHNPYSQHTMLLQLGPVLLVFSAALMLREKITRLQMAVAAVCLVGVGLILDPRLEGASLYLLLPLLAVLVQSIGNAWTAKHRDKATALGFTFWGAVGGWLCGLMGWTLQGAPSMPVMQWLKLELTAIIMALSVFAMLQGIKLAAIRGHAGTAGLMMYIQLPTAIVLGAWVLGEQMAPSVILGAVIIVVAGSVMVIFERSD